MKQALILSSFPKTILGTVLGSILAGPVFLSSGVAYAQSFSIGLPFTSGKSSFSNFGDYFTALMSFAVVIASLFAVGVIVYAGFNYITSHGDAQKMNTAKELITGSFIGLAILLLIRLILPTLGITNFS